ncbi:MAG TPA: helix-turn-helix domain-containing protein [Vicinamibacterales bacterium]|nr:helix-turn-helix domain-containing protein [Vicinamibacterales bacterium]
MKNHPHCVPGTTQSDYVPGLGRSVSISHAAQLLGVSRRTIYYRIKDGRLLTIRTRGGSQRVLVMSLQQLVLAQPPRRPSRRAVVA